MYNKVTLESMNYSFLSNLGTNNNSNSNPSFSDTMRMSMERSASQLDVKRQLVASHDFSAFNLSPSS